MERRKFIKSTAAGIGGIVVPTIVPASVFGKSAPSNKIQIGQIGYGRIAMSHDLPSTMRNDVARVIAVSDQHGAVMSRGSQNRRDLGVNQFVAKHWVRTRSTATIGIG